MTDLAARPLLQSRKFGPPFEGLWQPFVRESPLESDVRVKYEL